MSAIQPETNLASGTCFVTGCMNPATHKVYNPLPGSYDYAMLDVCEGHHMREKKLWWYRGRLYYHSRVKISPLTRRTGRDGEVHACRCGPFLGVHSEAGGC